MPGILKEGKKGEMICLLLLGKRLLLSRCMTRRKDGRRRKLLFIDARKAHLNSLCEDDVYVELPEECECLEGMCGKLK